MVARKGEALIETLEWLVGEMRANGRARPCRRLIASPNRSRRVAAKLLLDAVSQERSSVSACEPHGIIEQEEVPGAGRHR